MRPHFLRYNSFMLYMRNSAGAYKMMADLVRLSNSIADFIVRRSDVNVVGKRRRIFQHLVDVGCLEAINRNQYQITKIGKINMLHELVKRRKSDGKQRMIVFDIPEKNRGRRNAFRRHLKELGFKMEQQSVWSSQLPCEDLAKLVIELHGLKKFTLLLVGKLIP